MARDWRDDRIEKLEQENAALRAANCELRRCIAQLEARVRELEVLLARNCRQFVAPAVVRPAWFGASCATEANGPHAWRAAGA